LIVVLLAENTLTQVTGNRMTGELFRQFRLFLSADRFSIGAAGVEAAARGQVSC
jgi:hypothetical protein